MRCYVLAGGRSRRMGSVKAERQFAGRSFFSRVVEAAACFEEIVIVAHREFEQSASGLRVILDEDDAPRCALSGIRTALGDASERCWLLAVDYPLLRRDVLEDLRTRFEESHADLLVPVWRGLPQYLCAGYDPKILPVVDAQLSLGEFRLSALAARLTTINVAEQELRTKFAGEPLWNINTPEELEEAERDEWISRS